MVGTIADQQPPLKTFPAYRLVPENGRFCKNEPMQTNLSRSHGTYLWQPEVQFKVAAVLLNDGESRVLIHHFPGP